MTSVILRLISYFFICSLQVKVDLLQMAQALDSISCAELIQNTELHIIDVRTKDEFVRSRIPGAINIDIMANHAVETLVNLKKNQPYLIYCEIGVRSRSTIKIMEAMGFLILYELKNGLAQYTGPVDFSVLVAA